MTTLALLAALTLARPQEPAADPRLDFGRAELVVEGRRFPLVEVASPAETGADAPVEWLADGQWFVEHLLVPSPVGDPPLHVAIVGETAPIETPATTTAGPLRRRLRAPQRHVLLGGPAGAAPAWRRELGEHETVGGDGAALLGTHQPTRATGAAFVLEWLDGRVLVATGERGDLLLLEPSSGAVLRRLERPWEIERGFVGPSVWNVELGRFGSTSADEPTADELAAARSAHDARRLGWIALGPTAGSDRIALVVAHATPGPWVRERAEAALLELDLDLVPRSLTSLPSPPRAAVPVNGGVVLSLADGSHLCLEYASQDALRGLGPASDDGRARLRWLAPPVCDPHDAFWLLDRVGAPRLVLTHALLHVPVGGYVPRSDRARVVLRLESIAFLTGAAREFALEVPALGEVGTPTRNFHRTRDTWRLLEPRLASIAHLALEDVVDAGGERRRRLVVGIRTEDGLHWLAAAPELLALLDR
jgi:hypothetical protein